MWLPKRSLPLIIWAHINSRAAISAFVSAGHIALILPFLIEDDGAAFV